MAKADLAAFHREWNQRHDETYMAIWVSVDQVTGTRGSFRIVKHSHLPNQETTILARFTSDDFDNSEETLRKVLARLLEADENRRVLEEALEHPDA